ncbi:hypothetical protein P3S67_013809 [Capsicum chacoense]
MEQLKARFNEMMQRLRQGNLGLSTEDMNEMIGNLEITKHYVMNEAMRVDGLQQVVQVPVVTTSAVGMGSQLQPSPITSSPLTSSAVVGTTSAAGGWGLNCSLLHLWEPNPLTSSAVVTTSAVWGMIYQMLSSSVGVGMGSNPRPTTSSERSYVIVDPPYLTLHIVGTMPSMETSSIPTLAFQGLPSLAHSPGGIAAPYAYQPPLPMQPAAIGPPPRRPQRPTTMLASPPLPPVSDDRAGPSNTNPDDGAATSDRSVRPRTMG